ncbi:hypothetical protein K439DRAFT_1013891 [Ramaria rubella]|nr:hypothetical protein K439DRAFT_1013891 [Ramaria rubella]
MHYEKQHKFISMILISNLTCRNGFFFYAFHFLKRCQRKIETNGISDEAKRLDGVFEIGLEDRIFTSFLHTMIHGLIHICRRVKGAPGVKAISRSTATQRWWFTILPRLG